MVTESSEAPGVGKWQAWRKRLTALKTPIVIVAAVGTVAGGLAGWYNAYRAVRTASDTVESPSPPSSVQPIPAGGLFAILVLPLDNQTGDPAKDYIAAGLTSALTNDLARIQGAVVAPPMAAAALRERKLSIQALGAATGAQFVLQGAVQSAGERLRINAHLLDARSGAPLWSHVFEGTTGDLFALQDEVTTRIRAAVGPTMALREAAEAEKRPQSKAVADLTLRAIAYRLQPPTLERLQQMEQLSRQALAIEPDNVAAMEMLASSLLLQVTNFRPQAGFDNETELRMLAEMAAVARRILTRSPMNANACVWLAFDAMVPRPNGGRQPVAAREWAQRAVANDPNNYRVRNNVALIYRDLGEFDLARANAERSLALPRFGDGPQGTWLLLASVSVLQGRFDDAIPLIAKARSADPEAWDTYWLLVLVHGMQEDEQQARAAGAELLRRVPAFRISKALDTSLQFAWPGKEIEYREYIARGVRAAKLAGLPD